MAGDGSYHSSEGDESYDIIFTSPSHTGLDIVTTDYDGNTISVLLGHRHGSFKDQTTFDTSIGAYSVVVSGFHNDHLLEVEVANQSTNNIEIFLS